jgi:hypothetical protein
MKIILPYGHRPPLGVGGTTYFDPVFVPCCIEAKWFLEGQNGITVSPGYAGGGPTFRATGFNMGLSLKFCPFCGVPVVQETVPQGLVAAQEAVTKKEIPAVSINW